MSTSEEALALAEELRNADPEVLFGMDLQHRAADVICSLMADRDAADAEADRWRERYLELPSNRSTAEDIRAWQTRQLLDKIATLEAWKEAATVNYRDMQAKVTDDARHSYNGTETEEWL